jgi:hypothetical protein
VSSISSGKFRLASAQGRIVPDIESYELMINFGQFFVPYIQFLRGAAYNIAQIIEGLSPTTLTFVIGGADSRMELGYSVPIEFIAGMLLLYSFLLVGLIVVAAYILGRWRGAFVALLLLILPGVASIFGLVLSQIFSERVVRSAEVGITRLAHRIVQPV